MPVADDRASGKDRAKKDWEAGEVTRRDWIKLSLAVGAAGGVAALGVGVGASLLNPAPSSLYPPDAIRYVGFPEPQWWNAKDSQTMRVTDFSLWAGASGVWHGTYDESGHLIPGTGMPVLVIRIPRDDATFRSPPLGDVVLPAGYSLYYDDAARDLRFVVLYDRCAHLCCFPGWQVVTNPPPARDYAVPCPTYQVYGLDPVYCVCHGSQYDPMVLTKNVNPNNGVEYVGAERVHGPAGRAVPVLAVAVQDEVVYGALADARWYAYC